MTVKQIQHLRGYLGYCSGSPDGIWGRLSEEATRAFQSIYGLEADGVFGPATQKRILEVIGSGEAPRQEETEGTAWWKDIRYFTRAEFRCKCGGRYCNGYPAEMQESVVKIADAAREHFGKPAHVVSGLRCRQWNAHEGGVANSQHMYGEAIDLQIDGVDSETLRQFVATQPGHRYSYCINSTNVHFDIPAKSR